MSKELKNFNRIRQGEKNRALKALSEQYAKDNDLDEVTAPDVEVESGIIQNEKTLDQLLSDIGRMCDIHKENISGGGDFNTDKIGRDLRILKAACQVAIAKIETGW